MLDDALLIQFVRELVLPLHETIDAFFTPDFQSRRVLVVDFHAYRIDRKIMFLPHASRCPVSPLAPPFITGNKRRRPLLR